MDLKTLALTPGVISAILGFLITPLVIKLAWKVKLVDDPNKNLHPKVIHTYPVPRGGGLAIYLAVLVSILIFLPVDKHIIGIIAGATLITLIGLADDKWNLNPYLRIFLQGLAASLPIAAGIGIAFISNPLGPGVINIANPKIVFRLADQIHSIWILSDSLAIIWLVFMMNILNMGAKGVDGQLTGTTVIAAASIAALSLKFSADITQWPVITLAAITAGAFLGFLPWHIYPQKIMPSFGGASLAGFLLGVLAIISTTKVGVLTVTLAVPLIDTGYVIIRRIMTGKSPVWGDRGHLHHRLLDIGWSKTKVAAFYWAVTATLGLLALYLNTNFKFYTMIGVAISLLGLTLWLTYRPKIKT